ncbi:unnamed protein product, partial [Closterium sp. NIES-53]
RREPETRASTLERREPETRASTSEHREPKTRASVRAHVPRVRRSCAPAVPGTHDMTLHPSSVLQCVVLLSPPASSFPVVAVPPSDLARASSPTVTCFLATVVTDPTFSSPAASALVTELVDFAAAYLLDYLASLVSDPDRACPPSVGGEFALGCDVLEDRKEELKEAISGEYSSQWQTAMDIEMASWKSTSTYVNKVPPLGANIVSGMWIFRVKRPPGSPPAFKTRYVARGFSQREGVDFFQTFFFTPKMITLRVLLHVAAQRNYQLHSLDFSTAFLQGGLHETIWLRHPEGFTRSFPKGTQWSLQRPVYDLRLAPHEWHDTLRTTLAALVFAPSTADPSPFPRTDTTLLAFYILLYVLQRFGFIFTSPQPTPLSTGHSLSTPPSDKSVEPSGDLAFVTRLHLQSRGGLLVLLLYLVPTMTRDLRWLTYLLTDLGERPRSPPVMYIDNKAMLALCREQSLEHGTKQIALRCFLARELQQHGQLRLSYVASRANTADVFTKALGSGDLQRFCTSLGLLPVLPHLLVS